MSRISNNQERKGTGQLQLISVTQNGWVAEVMRSYDGHMQVQQVLAGIAANDDSFAQYQFQNGVLRHNGSIYLGASGEVKKKMLWELHDSPHDGHLVQDATYNRVF